MTATDPAQIALRVAQVLEALGIAYHLGGSLASSIYGEPRATNDIDLVVDLSADKVQGLADALGSDFAVDRESLAAAVAIRASCNIFYLPFFTKIDLFVAGRSLFERSEMRRRIRLQVGSAGETLYVKTPEDIVLRKLLWFLEGGGVSERQWRDVVEVLRLNRGSLDETVLNEWAPLLGIDDLLAKARVLALTSGAADVKRGV